MENFILLVDYTIGIQVFLLSPLLSVVSVTDVTINIRNTLLVPLFFVYTRTNITIGLVCLNRRYDRCFWLEQTLQSVFSIYGPVTNVTIGVIGSWNPCIF